MVQQNLHCHTTFDDGASTPEEMVCAAMEHGLSSLGISAHAPMDGEDWCTPKEKEAAFKAEMQRLKVKYAGKIALYTGLEYDAAAEKKFRRLRIYHRLGTCARRLLC